MNLTAKEMARREAEEMVDKGQVVVRLGVIDWNGIVMPVADEMADRTEEAVFKQMTYGDNKTIERMSSYTGLRPDGKEQMLIDVVEYKRMLLKKNLLSWTLDVPVERKNDWMTRECYKRVSLVSGTLLDAIVDKYEDTMIVTKEEESIIDRQASILFGKNSNGVANACEAVSMYCTLSSFNEKFGIRASELEGMSYRDYMRLRIMSSREAHASRASAPAGRTPVTKIAGPGGRVRQSRGVVVGRD